MESSKRKINVPLGGLSLCEALGIAFIVLKLCKVIAWPWIWVTAPLWIPIALWFTALIIWVIVYVIILIVKQDEP